MERPATNVQGVIKNFGPQKGFGFITCDEVPGDIYFQARELPSHIVIAVECGTADIRGTVVTFDLQYSPDGKPQAKNLVANTSGAGAAGHAVAEVEDGAEVYMGQVKSFNDGKGYGFLSCNNVEGDVYFQKRDVPAQVQGHNLVGMGVSFKTNVTPDGKIQARNLQFTEMPRAINRIGPSSASGKGCGKVGGKVGMSMSDLQSSWMMGAYGPMGPYGPMGASLMGGMGPNLVGGMPPQDGANLGGQIKSVNVAKGFGFIVSPGVPGDIYFKAAGQEFAQGQSVCFQLRWTQDGKPQANTVTTAMASGEEVIGTIKSFSDKNGYGFIAAQEYPQDIYFKKQDLCQELQGMDGQEVVGSQVSVTIGLQNDGKPLAKYMTFVSDHKQGVKRPRGAEEAAFIEAAFAKGCGGKGGLIAPAAKRSRVEPFSPAAGEGPVDGWVKSYNPGKGFGFIQAPAVGGADVYFKGSSLPEGCKDTDISGAQVRFTLNYTPDGKPQAADLQVEGM